MKIKPADSEKWYADRGDETLRQFYDLNEDSIVFDVGASVGDWSMKIYEKYKCNIYAFEPTNLYENYLEKFQGIQKIRLHKKAAYIFDGKIDLGIQEGEASIYHEDNLIRVNCIDFKKFLFDNNFKKIDLIKINIEGAEYPLLIDLIDNNMMQVFSNIQVQFHILDGFEMKYEYIVRKLAETHDITWRYPFVWENWKRKSS